MPKADLLVSAVAVLGNHADVVREFVRETTDILDRHYTNYELVLVDDGSVDGTPALIQDLLKSFRCVRCLRLSRPAGDETALIAGLDAAIGDYVVTIHPDFDPPDEIPALVEACRNGADLAIGIERSPRQISLLYRWVRAGFRRVASWLIRFDMQPNATGYRCLSRQAVNQLVKVRLRRRFFAVVAADVGLTTVTHPFERISRSGRRPVYRLRKAIRMGLSVLVHHSIAPLRLVSVFGLLGSLLSFLYSLYVVAVYLFKRDVMPGWTTLSLMSSGMFCLLFLMLALMGEYLGRLLEESADRPLYHVRDERSSAVMLTDLTRRNVLDRSDESDRTS